MSDTRNRTLGILQFFHTIIKCDLYVEEMMAIRKHQIVDTYFAKHLKTYRDIILKMLLLDTRAII